MPTVEFRAPGPDAYRVKVLGDDPAEVRTFTLIGAEASMLDLPPGDYVAFVEKLGDASRTSKSFEVLQDQRGLIDLTEQEESYRPRSQTLSFVRLSREAAQTEGNSRKLHTTGLDHDFEGFLATNDRGPAVPGPRRRLQIGVSYDSKPLKRGGWRMAPPDFRLISRDECEFLYAFQRPVDWKNRPRWRLTVAMEGERPIRVTLPFFSGGLTVAVRPTQTLSGADIRVELKAVVPATNVLVTSLPRANPGEAIRLMDDANVLTAGVFSGSDGTIDPWAAAAAALYMVNQPHADDFDRQTISLAEDFPWLPDAAIAAAWAVAALSEAGPLAVDLQCLRYLKQARAVGAPYFSPAIPLALELLRTLAGSSKDAAVRREARYQQTFWSRYGKRSLRVGPFLVWEDLGSGLVNGYLPSTYFLLDEANLALVHQRPGPGENEI